MGRHRSPMAADRCAPTSIAAARRAVGLVFFVNGAVLASWVPYVPEVKAIHGLSDGQLGGVLLALAVGAIFAMPVAGRLIGRFGSRRMTTLAALLFPLLLPLPLVSPNVLGLTAALALLGAANGTLDVSMNAQGLVIERSSERPIMSSLHALFSAGGLAGAAVASGVMALGIGRVAHALAVSLVAFASVAVVVRRLLFVATVRQDPQFAWPSRGLLGLGSLAFLGLLAEGAMADWSAVYLRDALGASGSVAAAGFAAFALAMALGRFAGDRLVARCGSAVLLRTSSGLAALGLAVALAVGSPVVAIAGFGAVGFGIANIIPLLFRAAGEVPGVESGTALAAVATTGYAGFLAGPVLIGCAADLVGLPIALTLVSVACAAIALRAGAVSAGPGDHPVPVASSTALRRSERPGA